ncbi:MAG: hypothetical protein TREMPRED_001560 [Tremellales sp. Tagirdzhanova-0007]|nr:MAG: hypothetical protein TREMPRED_001560 [Tremellales sp. Tagirdzhanova-0007]
MSKSPGANSEQDRIRKGVTFPALDTGAKPSSPRSMEGSRHRSSDEDALTSDSGRPLTSAGPSKSRPSPKIGKSPRFAPSPRTPGGITKSPSPKVGSSPQISRRSIRSMTLSSPRPPVRSARTFQELYDNLEEDEKDFFDLLEHELQKVEDFYTARETEAKHRAHDLRDQLYELAEHRKIYHELYPNGMPEWEANFGHMLPTQVAPTRLAEVFQKLHLRIPFVHEDNGKASSSNDHSRLPSPNGHVTGHADEARRNQLRDEMKADKEHHTYSPERYQKYKKELKVAVLDFYRHLEVIKNYRILNFTGFRKALKKFEKTTRIHCLEMYTDERISKEHFSSGRVVDDLIKQTEEMYTEHFEHGDSKKARDKLRKQFKDKTHYYSVFRAGNFIGLGLPAAVFGLVLACKAETREAIPAWNGLLQVYGALYLPVIFALLFQLNLEAWFVMELSHPTIDYRSYAELPAFLFMTLSYCLFFSFYRVSSSHVAPTTWPAAWLVFLAICFINPLPIFRRSSRWWLLRVLFRVLTPGISRVEFIAFFLADELNSLVYSIQSVYFLSCACPSFVLQASMIMLKKRLDAHSWPADVYTVCPSGQSWPYAILLCLPALSRAIQCLKRYWDSRLGIHLINAGKYVGIMCQYCMFVLWRSRGSPFHDASFIAWIIVATISASYACSWDLIIDWSLFRPNAKLLREELGYSNRYVYYFAMVSNFLIRFIFLWYIPASARHTRLRSFFFASAEMLRRWQWNFFRVETEHLGNADAYRVTREIPLPYRRIEKESDDDADLHRAMTRPNPISVHLDRIRRDLTGNGNGPGPTHENGGTRNRHSQRKYEARRAEDTHDSTRADEV